MIVSLDWLVGCLDDPTQVDSDWKFIMTGIQFENKTHYDTKSIPMRRIETTWLVISNSDFHSYRPGYHNLNDFTHFAAIPNTPASNVLSLDLSKLLVFEALAKPGMIVSLDWLDACLDDPAAVDLDWKFALTDVCFENNTYANAITRMKRDLHRKRPPLFYGFNFTILPTTNRRMQATREFWNRIIEGFGGTCSMSPIPGEAGKIPYHLVKRNLKVPSASIDSSVVLYFNDSVLHEKWTFANNCISFLGMGWLVECIVRYRLIPSDHPSLKYEADPQYLPVIFEKFAADMEENSRG
eukprot:NP_494303.1 Uncharacterized protein CELE_F33H12.1 [Caenorhabditis elegans]